MNTLKSHIVLLFLLITMVFHANAKYSADRVEPPFWWVGMKNTELQIMVYGPSISKLEPQLAYKGVELREVIRVQNPNYLFLILYIDPKTNPGKFDLAFLEGSETEITYTYYLNERESTTSERWGFTNADAIYLITPDRFANGDPSNDSVAGYYEGVHRSDPQGRHGGDIRGIRDHLDYIADMGFTALWLTPVLENNMKRTSYHGYAITDFYKVDPRFGTNEDYKLLSEDARAKGIKLIMDMVMNHCGSEHWWMKDLPSDDWIHNKGKYIRTNHQRSTVQDPYAPSTEKKMFTNGWFVSAMPDMNQKNPLLAQYLIQNSIWWIEYDHLQGIRHDTHSYSDKQFLSDWTCAVMNEYPNFNIVGEEWSPDPAIIAYWQRGKQNPDGYTSCLPSLMDFPTEFSLIKGLNEPDTINNEGLIEMYKSLADDFLYADPYNLVIFPDNHDMTRFYSQLHQNFDLYKMGIAYILTMRGIPQIYYGTEILKTSPEKRNDGLIRSDFPGGWPGDPINAFTGKGLTDNQKEAQDYMKKLINWRKNETCVQTGELLHYLPQDGVYVYFRYNNRHMVMVVLNKNKSVKKIDTNRFAEVIGNRVTGRDIISGKTYNLHTFDTPARTALVLELE